MGDLSSLTEDQIRVYCIEVWGFNQWTAREVPSIVFQDLFNFRGVWGLRKKKKIYLTLLVRAVRGQRPQISNSNS